MHTMYSTDIRTTCHIWIYTPADADSSMSDHNENSDDHNGSDDDAVSGFDGHLQGNLYLLTLRYWYLNLHLLMTL